MVNVVPSFLATILSKERTQQPLAGLADLPNELINNLIRDLHAETLCCLAMTCKRLHYLALPIIFYRAGIDPASKNLVLREPSESFLRALRLALFVNPTTVDFYPNREVHRMLPDVCTLRVLIARMPEMERLTLNLSWFDTWLESAKGPDKVDADRWKEEMCELLDDVLLKSCSTLKVLGGNLIPSPYIPNPRRFDDSPLSQPYPPVRTPLFHRKLPPKVRRVKNPTHSSLPATGVLSSKHPQSLRKLHLHCQMLFEPPFLCWTQPTLQAHAASITDCSIKAILHREIWKNIFDNLSLPNLSKLEYLSDLKLHPWPIGLEFATIAAFLVRHPSITVLNLYGILERPTKREPPLQKVILPELVEIKAHPMFIAWLLRPTEACRNLTKVTISSELYPVTLFDYNLFDNALFVLAHRSKSIELCFQFTLMPGAVRWMEAHVSQGHTLSIVTRLHVKNLGIHSNYWLIIFRDMPAVFAEFLALFPCLDHVDFVDERACPAEVERVKVTVIKQIALKCPGMKTVAIDSQPGSPFVDLTTLRN
ncbi:hypothetical protein K443DRAFT_679728 [Laccaria amethystina LaAM-08-1]|uniref:F-box domain-containing protein n=1 Tax=Laccaria amethystina LaAM-08-1 TaxID=1095629 RepID=A0A0C9XUT1_9AGAR|nr:hypothetical protein K443DRAFT_679728 [Laccaria amethystina LaAM-08-1]